jgi:hypothetical protein
MHHRPSPRRKTAMPHITDFAKDRDEVSCTSAVRCGTAAGLVVRLVHGVCRSIFGCANQFDGGSRLRFQRERAEGDGCDGVAVPYGPCGPSLLHVPHHGLPRAHTCISISVSISTSTAYDQQRRFILTLRCPLTSIPVHSDEKFGH